MKTLARWRATLVAATAKLAYARRQAAYWRRRKTKAKPHTAAWSHASAMLDQREKNVHACAYQVAYARRVVAHHSPRASLAKRALAEAEHVLARHVMETGGNNRGQAVEEIIHYAGGDTGEPWCVDFDIWCYGHAGSTVIHSGYPRAVSMMDTAGVHSVQTPSPGDPVRYSFDHTGIYVRHVNATTIETIEGNTGAAGAVSDGNGSDGVYRKHRDTSLVRDYLRVER